MLKHNKKLYTGILIAILFGILFGVIVIFSATWRLNRQVATLATTAISPALGKENSEIKNTEKIILILGNETIDLSFASNALFYNALVQAKNTGTLSFDGKNYPGLGFFVTDIGSLHSGGGKDLLYYVNGKEASVGVSSYILKGGDIIEWKLE